MLKFHSFYVNSLRPKYYIYIERGKDTTFLDTGHPTFIYVHDMARTSGIFQRTSSRRISEIVQ